MILRSRLDAKAFKTAEPKKYLTGDTENLDPVFAARLAFVAKDTGKPIHITDGYRSLEEQKQMYADYKAGKLQATAAVPGTSWHGTSLAVDTSTYPIRGMNNAQLAKYGLCKPLSKEGWHIQPIETANMGSRANYVLTPENLSDRLKDKFGLAAGTIKYLEAYPYAYDLFLGLLAGKKTFSQATIDYILAYEWGKSLAEKLGLQLT